MKNREIVTPVSSDQAAPFQWLLSRLRIREIATDTGWAAIGQVLALTGNVALVKVFVARLGPAGYGDLSIAVSISAAFSLFIYGPLGNSALRYSSQYGVRNQSHLAPIVLWSFHRSLLIVTGILTVICVLAGNLFNTAWGSLLAASVIFAQASGLCAGISSICNGRQEHIKVALFRGIDPWARFI